METQAQVPHPQQQQRQGHAIYNNMGPTATSTSIGLPPQYLTMQSMTQEQQEEWEKNRLVYQQQLLTEHFGAAPLSFVDDVINSVNNMIYQASMALQEFIEFQLKAISQTAPGHEHIDPKLETEQGMHKFETLLESSVDKNFDRFELYALKNIFGVPKDVDIILPHYAALDFSIESEREQELDTELEDLRRQVIATKSLNFKLRNEFQRQEREKRKLEQCREKLLFLKEALVKFNEVVPMNQTTMFVLDNIEALNSRYKDFFNRTEAIAREHHHQNNNGYIFSLLQQQNHQLSNSSQGKQLLDNNIAKISPPDTIPLALREAILCQPPDQRAMYFRALVRQRIEECMEEVMIEKNAGTPSTMEV